MLVHELLNESASFYPERIAVIHDKERVTYFNLQTMVNNLAANMLVHGIRKGDRIALLLNNGVDYIVAYYAALLIGGIVAPLNPANKPDGLRYLLKDLAPSAIISGAKSERLIKATGLDAFKLKILIIRNPKQDWKNISSIMVTFEDAIADKKMVSFTDTLHESDTASIIYTSGSTGKPKGVMLSHQNIVSNTKSICQYLSLSKDDIQMVVLPFFYVMGKSLLNTHIAAGGTVIVNNRFMYPADVVHQMIEEKVTGFSGVPSTYAYLLNRSPLVKCRDKLNQLRYCSQAGGHMAKSLKMELQKALPEHTEIVIMYGATEAAARLTYLDPRHFDSKIESIGKPIPGVSIRVLDENGLEVGDGKEGELVASGPNIMVGYWNDPKGSAEVLTEHGYHTGDVGYRDTDGFLYAVRRKDGLMKVGGHRVNPTEIEDFLMTTQMIIETAVVGLPDKLLGTKLVAVVVPKDTELKMDRLIRACGKELPAHKCPSEFLTIRALPKNANGKVDRTQCAEVAKSGIQS